MRSGGSGLVRRADCEDDVSLLRAILRRLRPVSVHEHITERERSILWQRYQVLRCIDARCPRPDNDSD